MTPGPPRITYHQLLLLVVAAVAALVFILIRNPGFACLLLQVVEFLAGGVNRFLLSVNIAFELRIVLFPLGGVAQTGTRIAIEGGGAQAVFSRRKIGLMVQGVNFFFLFVELLLPLVRRFVAIGSGSGGSGLSCRRGQSGAPVSGPSI